LVQGDMVADDRWAQRSLLESIALRAKWVGNLWPEASAIPYCFAANFPTASQTKVRAAITHIEAAVPCLRFRHFDSNQEVCNKRPGILFGHAEGDKCSSQVGVQRTCGPTRTFLGSSSDSQCLMLGTAVHEVLHALGMLHEQPAAPGNHEPGLTVDEASMLARMYNCVDQRVAPKIGSTISMNDDSLLKATESARQQKSLIAVHDHNEEHFQVVDAGPGTIALWNTNSHRFLVMDPAGRVGFSAVYPTVQLPTAQLWAWAKFAAVETSWGGTAFYSLEHDRFLRVHPWSGIVDAGHRSALRRSHNTSLPQRATGPWMPGPFGGDWNFEPFSNSAQVEYKLLFDGCCGGPGAPEPVDETPALAFEECQAQCTADLSCDAIEVSACSRDSKDTLPCRGHCRLFSYPGPQFLSNTCFTDGHMQCYQKVWKG